MILPPYAQRRIETDSMGRPTPPDQGELVDPATDARIQYAQERIYADVPEIARRSMSLEQQQGMGLLPPLDFPDKEGVVRLGNVEKPEQQENLGELLFMQNPDLPEPLDASVLGAAFRQENTLASALTYAGKKPYFEPVEGFDPMQEPDMEAYYDFWPEWISARSPEELSFILGQIDSQIQDAQVLANNPGAAMAAMIPAVLTDPVYAPLFFIPALNMVRAGKPAQTAGVWMTSNGIAELAAERAKHATQVTRTMEQSAINITVTTLLSGIMGATFAKLSKPEKDKLIADMTAYLMDDKAILRQQFGPDLPSSLADDFVAAKPKAVPGAKNAADEASDSVSAARATAYGADDAEAYELVGAAFLEKLPQNPLIRLSTSPIPMIRSLVLQLVDSPYYYKGHMQGKALSANSIESQMKQYMARHYDAVRYLEQKYFEYRKDITGRFKGTKAFVSDLTGRTRESKMLTFDEFKAEVAKAKRRDNQSDIKEVADVAKYFDDNVYEYIRKQAIDAGSASESMAERSANYLHRIYDWEKIAAETETTPNGFHQRLFDWLSRERDRQRQLYDYERLQAVEEEKLVKEYTGRVNEAKTYFEKLRERAKDFKKSVLRWDIDLNDASQVRRALKLDYTPKSVAVFIRDGGGIVDEGGELAARDITNKRLAGLVRKDSSRAHTMDYWRTRLWEEGYFPYGTSEYHITDDEILDLLTQDLFEGKIFTDDVMQQLAEANYFAKELDDAMKAGLGRNSTLEQVERYIQNQDRLGFDPKVDKFYAEERLASLKGNLNQRTTKMDDLREFALLEDRELHQIVRQTIDNIIGQNKGRYVKEVLPDHPAFRASALKERTLKIRDEMIEDYLINDIERVTKAYTRSMAASIELTRNYGDEGMDNAFAEITLKYADLRRRTAKKMRDEGSPEADIEKAMADFRKREARDVADLEALRQKILGVYKLPEDPHAFWIRVGDFVKQYNFTRLLGGMTISALPDLARPVMTQGFAPTFKMLRSLGSSAYKMNAEELKLAGIAWEAYSNARLYSWADLTDDIMYRSKLEKGMHALSRGFSKATLMPFWNDALKSFSGVVVQENMIKAIMRKQAGQASQREIRELAKARISDDAAQAIYEQIMKHGKQDDIWIPNVTQWDDPGLQSLWRSSIQSEVERIIVTPGMGEMPLWVSGPVASHIMQFKSFALSAQSKVLMSGLQARDKAALEGMMLAIGLGVTVYSIKQASAGRDITDNPGDLIFEGVDRSGMLGWLNEPLQTVAKVTGGQVSLGRLWGSEQAGVSRYQSRNLMGLLGPSTDVVGDFASMSRALSTGEWSEGDVKAGRRLMPGHTLFYMRWLFDSMQQQVAEEVVNQ